MTLEFALVVEKGKLEAQALLLCSSLRRFAGRYANSKVTAISPRKDRRPTASTIQKLADLQIDYVESDTISVEPEYGSSFRMYAAAEVEAVTRSEHILFMDSDILFSAEPSLELLGADAVMRPVDVKGMCSGGKCDPMDAYWQKLCQTCGVDYEQIPFLQTTVDKEMVKASYNGGFVLVRSDAGIFSRALDYFKRSSYADLRPWRNSGIAIHAGSGIVSRRGSEMWGSSQACLSLAIWGNGLSAKTFDLSHNFPLHMLQKLNIPEKNTPLVAIHYHHMLDDPLKDNPLFNGEANVSAEFVQWLKQSIAA